MKATIGNIQIEGTREEIEALVRSLLPDLTNHRANNFPTRTFGTDMTEEFAFRVLKRRPLSAQTTVILSLLLKQYPNWTPATDLMKAVNYTPSQLAGTLGALGKRVSGTEGYDGNSRFFDNEWDYDIDCYKYRLVPGAASAVERAKL